jgi:hypothetical protein
MKALALIGALLLSACGGSDRQSASEPPAMLPMTSSDSFFSAVHATSGMASDDTEPASVDLAATSPEDAEPAALK